MVEIMPDATIDTVIFDMDDVLCGYDRAARVRHMAETTGLAEADIVAAIWGSGFDDAADEGAFTAAEYLAETQRRLGRPITARQWAAARKAGMTPNPEMLELAGRVAERATIACFTNNGPLMRERMAEIFPEVPALFGARLFFSADIGLGKPKPEAFLAVLERLNASPTRTLFIDDNEGYTVGAAAAGLHVHRFSDAETLVDLLRGFSLL